MTDMVTSASVGRRRVKVGATLDPSLVRAVDAYVADHPDTDRSEVIDEALRLWYARQQRTAMEVQFAAPVSATEGRERASWRATRRAAALRTFRKGR